MSSSSADWVAVAVLGKTRGNRGEITALALSSKPERFENLREVYLFRSMTGATAEKFEVESTWFHQEKLILKFRGVDSISEAELLVGAEVCVPMSERVPLDPGEYFESDLIGCEVVDQDTGESLGRVSAWQDAGGPGLLEVDGNLLIPFVKAICVVIDPQARRIEVRLPEGLRDLNRS